MSNDANPSQTIKESVETAIREATALAQSARFDEAEATCMAAARDLGDHAELWKCLGAVRHHRGDSANAAAAFQKAVDLAPDDAGAWSSLGLMLATADRSGEAIAALRKALEIDPGQTAAARNLGLSLMKSGKPAEARDVYRTLAAQLPNDADVLGWLGHASAAADDIDTAYAAYKRSLQIQPGNQNLELTLALVERDLGLFPASRSRFDRLLAARPDDPVLRFAQAQNFLLQGDFVNGFREYEWRWKRPGMEVPEFNAVPWQGEDVAGKTFLLHDEQGLGDTIQFCRFAATLRDKGAAVTLLVRPRLRRLISSLSPNASQDIAVIDTVPPGASFDFHCPLMSIPYRLGMTLADIPAPQAYLTAEDELIAQWRPKLAEWSGGKLAVGLNWQGDPSSQSERGRSLPFDALRGLLALEGIHFFLLQKQHGRDALAGIADLPNVTDLGDALDLGDDAFVDTAAVMHCLDIVVTSDTGPAHLAGAIGARSWVLLKKVPEWRWGTAGSAMPWYPTMRLFRQSVRGDWSGPVREIANALKTSL
ncbi:tetratricopeptide repeat protein [Hwanghaeella grinnelliae]|nr:tetratricopeptide repeat protein [Hwanghaeella grinnelliae]